MPQRTNGVGASLPARFAIRPDGSRKGRRCVTLSCFKNGRPSCLIDRDRDNFERLFGRCPPERVQQRQFASAGRTPGRPEIHQDGPAAKRIQRNSLAVDTLDHQSRNFAQGLEFDELRASGAQHGRPAAPDCRLGLRRRCGAAKGSNKSAARPRATISFHGATSQYSKSARYSRSKGSVAPKAFLFSAWHKSARTPD